MTGNGLTSVLAVARYRGRFGQWDWVLRRLAGLGVVLFLVMHIIDTGTVYWFGEPAYEWWVGLYKSAPFALGEIALAGAVVYHAMSGLAIIVLDLFPSLWQWRKQAQLIAWGLFIVVFTPIGLVMLARFAEHNLIR